MFRGAIVVAVLAACLTTGVAGATDGALILSRSIVTGLAADGGQVAFVAAKTASDCDRVFIWQSSPRRTIQLGKKQRCRPLSKGPSTVAFSGGRTLWVTSSVASGRTDWQLWTATATKTTPRRLLDLPRAVNDPQPIVLGTAGGGLLPYAVDSTVTTMRASGTTAFPPWTAPGHVVALAATTDGRVAVVDDGMRVTVLDAHGKVLSVDLYLTQPTAAALTVRGLLVQRGSTLELRREAAAQEFAAPAGSNLVAAQGKWAVTSDGRLAYAIRLTDGVQKATYPGSAAALAGNRLCVANGRAITVRTIR